MSYHYPKSWDYIWMIVLLLTVISVIGWISYGIWNSGHQPYRPLDPRQEYVNDCHDEGGVPNVQTNTWSCIKP